ncbi:MAG: hypothetical protein RQ826_10825 [Xanthomonadales bacterium]|nr:hypothetical protein [Xanthomonadales bacterium]
MIKAFERCVANLAFLCLFSGGLFALVPAVQAQSNSESPYIETRLWCPNDIELFYQEMKSREADLPEHVTFPRLSNAGVYLLFTPIAFIEVIGKLVEITFMPESEIMRKVAYNILRQWPAAKNGVVRTSAGGKSVFTVPGALERGGREHADSAIHGIDLLKTVWRNWRAQWMAIRKLASGGYDPVTIEKHIMAFADRWGENYEEVPNPVPDGWLPEECDCKWFLSVEQDGETLFYAVFVKKGSIFDVWTADNTEVVSYFAGRDSESQTAPYPTEMVFVIPFHRKGIYFTEDTYYFWRNQSATKLTPRRRSGQSPAVSFEFKYPMTNDLGQTWSFAEAVVSSSPGEDFMDVFEEIKRLKALGLRIGEHFRAWAGPFRIQ